IYFVLLSLISLGYSFVVPVKTLSYSTVVGYIFFSGLTTGINFFYQAKILLILQAEGDIYINSLITMGVYFLTSIVKIGCILAGFNIIIIQIGYFIINLLGTFIY